MILEAEKFRSFELAGWQEIPAGYHEAFGRLTRQASSRYSTLCV